MERAAEAQRQGDDDRAFVLLFNAASANGVQASAMPGTLKASLGSVVADTCSPGSNTKHAMTPQ